MDRREQDLIDAAQRLSARLRGAGLRQRLDAALEGQGASFDELVTLADGDSETLMGWMDDRRSQGTLDRVNGHPEADGSLVSPSLFRRAEPRDAG